MAPERPKRLPATRFGRDREPGARTAAHQPDVVGDLVERHGERSQRARQLHQGVVRALHREFVRRMDVVVEPLALVIGVGRIVGSIRSPGRSKQKAGVGTPTPASISLMGSSALQPATIHSTTDLFLQVFRGGRLPRRARGDAAAKAQPCEAATASPGSDGLRRYSGTSLSSSCIMRSSRRPRAASSSSSIERASTP
jgi:hypothetical protein